MRGLVMPVALAGAVFLSPALALDAQSESIQAGAETGPLPLGWQPAGAARIHSSGLRCDIERDGFLRAEISGGMIEPAGCAYLNSYDIRIRVVAGEALEFETDRLMRMHGGLTEREFRWAELPDHSRLKAYRAPAQLDPATATHVLVIAAEDFTLSLDYPAMLEGEALEAASRFLDAGLLG